MEIECGELFVAVRGSLLTSLDAGANEASELTLVGEQLLGNGHGRPTLTNWYNQNGTLQEAKLESTFGGGFVKTAEEVRTRLVPLLVLNHNMVVLTGR